jgi:hypothetical protein
LARNQKQTFVTKIFHRNTALISEKIGPTMPPWKEYKFYVSRIVTNKLDKSSKPNGKASIMYHKKKV